MLKIEQAMREIVNIGLLGGERTQENLLDYIDKTARLVQEITAASKEQNSGAEQVNNALQELNNVMPPPFYHCP